MTAAHDLPARAKPASGVTRDGLRETPAIDVQSLLQGQAEIRLVHRGEAYRLRVTRQGKLILTK